MEQALGKQQNTKQGKALDLKNRDHADETLKRYESKIKQVVYGKFKGMTDVSTGDREDVIIDVCHAFWELLNSGKFKGEHGEASIKSCISTIAQNKRNNFLKRLITEKKYRAYEPLNRTRQCKPDGGVPTGLDPWPERFPPYFGNAGVAPDPVREYEKKKRDEFIERETKYPEIIDSYRKGYSIKVIARIYGLTDEQVRKRIQREKKRLAKIAKQQGWYYK